MAYILRKIGNADNVAINYYEVDTERDIQEIDIANVPMGSRCYVVNTGSTYALNSSKEWKLVPTSGADGYSPAIDVSREDDKTVLTITDVNGTKTVDIPDGKDGAVSSVNGKTGDVTLTAGDVGAISQDDLHGHKLYLSVRSSDAPNMVVNGITLEHRSDLMPTKQDLDNAKFRWLFLDDKGEINISGEYLPTISTMLDSDVLYGGIVGDGSVFLVVAYKSGDQTISFNGEDIAINIPKTGMYISIIDAGQKNTLYGVYAEWVDIVQINELLIPTLSGINLRSSSRDKVFRLTVDDTGAITATEVTT